MSYISPEMLGSSYTSQSDIWGFGVILFALLSGVMPFPGSEDKQRQKIRMGQYTMKPEKWSGVSVDGQDFVRSLLCVNPEKRPTAEVALKSRWIECHAGPRVCGIGSLQEGRVVDALRDFGKASKFRRRCLEMIACTLSNEDTTSVRDRFLEMDHTLGGTVTWAELSRLLVEHCDVPMEEFQQIFKAMDSNGDMEIRYRDFLAAMAPRHISLTDDALFAAFTRFDVDSSGFISENNLQRVLGEDSQDDACALLREGDLLGDGRISLAEFAAYLRGMSVESQQHLEGRLANVKEQALPTLLGHRRKNAGDAMVDKKPKPLNVIETNDMQPKACCALM